MSDRKYKYPFGEWKEAKHKWRLFGVKDNNYSLSHIVQIFWVLILKEYCEEKSETFTEF